MLFTAQSSELKMKSETPPGFDDAEDDSDMLTMRIFVYFSLFPSNCFK